MRKNYAYRKLTGIIPFFVLLFLMILTSCSNEKPSKDHLLLFLEEQLFKNYNVQLRDVDAPWIKTGEKIFKSKVHVVIKMNETLYEPANESDLKKTYSELLGETEAIKNLVDKAHVRSKHFPEQYNSQIEKQYRDYKELNSKSIEFIKPIVEQGKEFAYDLYVLADKSSGEQIFKISEMAEKIEIPGKSRSSFPENTYVLDSKETKELISKLLADMKAYITLVEETEKQIASDKEKAVTERHKELLDMIKPGSFFLGTEAGGDRPSIGLAVEQVEGDVVSGHLFDVADPRKKYPFSGTVGKDPHPLLLFHPGFDLFALGIDAQTKKLTGEPAKEGKLRVDNITFNPIETKELEALTTAAVKKEEQEQAAVRKLQEQEAAAERQRREAAEAHLKALLDVVKPGAVFLGAVVDKYNRVKYVGLSVERVTDNAVTGQVFDVNDPRKKEPFNGAINSAQNPELLYGTARKMISLDRGNGAEVFTLDIEQGTKKLIGIAFENGRENGRASFTPVEAKEIDARITAVVQQEEQIKAEALAKEEQRKAEERKRQEQQAAAERQKREAAEAHLKALLDVVKPGAVFLGTVVDTHNRVKNVGLSVDKVTGNAVTGQVFDVNDPRKKESFNGAINSTQDPELLYGTARKMISLDRGNGAEVFALDIEQGAKKLIGIASENGRESGRASFTPVEAKEIDARIAAVVQQEEQVKAEALAKEEQRKAEERKRQEQEAERKRQYKEKLAKAVAPGSAYQGIWSMRNANEAGEVGFVIEKLGANELSCEGFFFDPADRSKRKSFSGIINWEYNAASPLLLKTVRGRGLQDNGKLTNVQRAWLAEHDEYSLTLDFTQEGDGWAGQTDQGGTVRIKPLPDFARMVEQDKLAEQQRQQAILDAVKPGSAWSGTVQCRDYAGELGVYFEQYQGGATSGYFFDPSARDQRRKFNGAVSTVVGAVPLKLTVAYESRIDRERSVPAVQQHWLGNDEYTVSMKVQGGAMKGQRDHGDCTLALTPLQNYATLLQEDAAKEKVRRQLLVDMVKPGNTFTGTWRDEKHSGEIGMKILTRGESGVVFTAELYDPAEPRETWPLHGSVLMDKPGRYTLTPAPREEGRNRQQEQPGSTQYLINRHHHPSTVSTLLVKQEGLEGELYNEVHVQLKSPLPIVGTVKGGLTEKQAAAPAEGKPSISAVLAEIGKEDVTLSLALHAPGKVLTTLRIDNIGGKRSLWTSDSAETAGRLTVSRDRQVINPDNQRLQLALGAEERTLSLTLRNNGAFGDGATEFRVTAFFSDATRVLCAVKKK